MLLQYLIAPNSNGLISSSLGINSTETLVTGVSEAYFLPLYVTNSRRCDAARGARGEGKIVTALSCTLNFRHEAGEAYPLLPTAYHWPRPHSLQLYAQLNFSQNETIANKIKKKIIKRNRTKSLLSKFCSTFIF
ncbi:uncharacterized protein LOC132785149 [Drosophila nasuta]|uniref:uncharacterized protein LOC132785149 n=1 Tax=Drosophila nasuta TaxID=42062 RepID=UPI00295E729C|nr:uncharacterized protein LOC132785149 [Drosophila nasuta]